MGTYSNAAVWVDGLVVIGGFTVLFYFLKFSWKCWWGLRVYVLSEYWKTDLRTYGQWAVVTGATSGIGKAYANELAKRGLDIVLVSRSEEKLKATALDIVNNVGMTYSPGLAYYMDIPNPGMRITEIINCNILSVAQMTRLILPRMVERSKGLIINISSEAGSEPQPMLTLYSATKIFVTYFSRGLNAEYSPKGVTVQCVAPFLVSTNMTNNRAINAFVKSAQDFAYEALNTVGHSTFTSGCLSHALQHIALCIFFPGWLRLSSSCVRKTEKFARRAQQKIERTGKKEN
ncbi:hypothetical protein JZ751_022826 [Albula glossodonta]|uniref:Uncharacterized protein n=1 Tax=Albula glossodonta TaxID=121402 RepID=A0A8T2PG97_9TELE|nr:hypothetical protein JZ751_022826 [Albula glossodonta]